MIGREVVMVGLIVLLANAAYRYWEYSVNGNSSLGRMVLVSERLTSLILSGKKGEECRTSDEPGNLLSGGDALEIGASLEEYVRTCANANGVLVVRVMPEGAVSGKFTCQYGEFEFEQREWFSLEWQPGLVCERIMRRRHVSSP